MKKAAILGGIIMIGCCAVFIYLFGLRYFTCKGLSCIDFIGRGELRLKEEYEKKDNTYRALFEKGENMVRVESYTNITPDRANEFTTYKTMQIQNVYETLQSPYPGILSDRITCEDELKAKFGENTDGTQYFTAFLNDRLQYGNCLRDELVYQSIGVMKYCPDHKIWYYLEFISPKSNNFELLTPILESIKCL